MFVMFNFHVYVVEEEGIEKGKGQEEKKFETQIILIEYYLFYFFYLEFSRFNNIFHIKKNVLKWIQFSSSFSFISSATSP